MNPKQLSILALVAVIAGGIYFFASSKREGTTSGKKVETQVEIGDRAVKDFAVPDVTKLTIKQKNREVNLTKDGGEWLIAERENYSADANKVRGLLYTIKDMQVADRRNSRGQSVLKSLNLLDPDESGEGGAGAGTKVKIELGSDARSLVFGANYDSAGRTGRFIKSSSGDVYVVSTVLRNLETDPAAWLDKTFFSVEKAERVSVQHEKPEDSFTVYRESEGSPLDLEDPAEDEELSTSKSSRLGNLFSGAKFADYVVGEAAKPENTGLDNPLATATIETFDKFKYVVKIGKKTAGGKYHLSYDVSAEIPEPPAPEPEEETPATAEGDKELTEAEQKQKDEEAAKQAAEKKERQDLRDKIKRLNEKLATEKKYAGKVYLVDSWTAADLLKKRSEIIMTEEDKKKAAEDAANKAAGGGGSPGGGPSVIGQGPNGKRRITATTPPVSLDPAAMKAYEAERKKQEQAVIEKAKQDADSAAIRKMLEDHQKAKADAAKESETPATTENPASEGDKPAEADKPAPATAAEDE